MPLHTDSHKPHELPEYEKRPGQTATFSGQFEQPPYQTAIARNLRLLHQGIYAYLLAWVVGILAGYVFPWLSIWLALAGTGWLASSFFKWKKQVWVAQGMLLLSFIALGASHYIGQTAYVPRQHISKYISDQRQLVALTGTIQKSPVLQLADQGAMAKFSWQGPSTLAIIQLKTLEVSGQSQPSVGRLLLQIGQADMDLRQGDDIAAQGWLSRFALPANPGEANFREIFQRQNIVGVLRLKTSDNWQRLEPTAKPSWLTRLRQGAIQWSDQSLMRGLPEANEQTALLRALLIGQRQRSLTGMYQQFQEVGLAHILSISGAHLGILLGLVWLAARLVLRRPSQIAWVVAIVLIGFLLIVPWRIPIVRAALMAGLFTLSYGSGRRIASGQLLALAMLLVLLVLPGDLFSAGFQLSFLAVASIMFWTARVSSWIWPKPLPGQIYQWWPRFLADVTAVNVVAFGVSFPLVAYHFQMVTPYTIVLSFLALPAITLVLGLGYVKILVGLLFPTISHWLAGPLSWAGDNLILLVSHAGDWPGATWRLQASPSVYWVAATLAVVAALFSGWLSARRKTLVLLVLICASWLAVTTLPASLPFAALSQAVAGQSDALLSINMLSVGDGSCYLLRFHPNALAQSTSSNADDEVLMYDCGSKNRWNFTHQSLLPAMRSLGINHVDTLIISHGNLDHFNGSIDLIKNVPVGRLLVTPYLLKTAHDFPASAAGVLIASCRASGINVETVSQGWQQTIGTSKLQILWPTLDLKNPKTNDTSIVLRIDTAGKSLLLTGDIQTHAMTALLKANKRTLLDADICELPHHGSYSRQTTQLLAAISPSYVLQSCGQQRYQQDRWASTLNNLNAQRFISFRDGMTQLRISPSGKITWQTFKPNNTTP